MRFVTIPGEISSDNDIYWWDFTSKRHKISTRKSTEEKLIPFIGKISMWAWYTFSILFGVGLRANPCGPSRAGPGQRTAWASFVPGVGRHYFVCILSFINFKNRSFQSKPSWQIQVGEWLTSRSTCI